MAEVHPCSCLRPLLMPERIHVTHTHIHIEQSLVMAEVPGHG